MTEAISKLRVSENKRFLIEEDGSMFFWLGDTAWELFHKLDKAEADHYLQNRAERKFNVIQAVALAEEEGLTKENAYGRLPLLRNSHGEFDPSLPDLSGEGYSYWDHVDYMIKRAEEFGLYIGFLPTWGDKINKKGGSGPEIFTAENALAYGKFLGERYKEQDNIIWILGGDRRLDTRLHYSVVHAMAEGIRAGDGGRHLITFHPNGGGSSADYVHDEQWLDLNMIQSGHTPIKNNYKMINAAYDKLPTKPVLDGEPCYEDIPISFKSENGFIDAADVRRAAYWGVFAGGCGHTYGHNTVWQMATPFKHLWGMEWHWKDGLLRPGGAQMQYLRKLVESRRFLEHVPDQSLLVENHAGANHMHANRCNDCALIYIPCGIQFKVNMGVISGDQVHCYWFDPRNGSTVVIGNLDNKGKASFVPPSFGRGEDWVLVLEDTRSQYELI